MEDAIYKILVSLTGAAITALAGFYVHTTRRLHSATEKIQELSKQIESNAAKMEEQRKNVEALKEEIVKIKNELQEKLNEKEKKLVSLEGKMEFVKERLDDFFTSYKEESKNFNQGLNKLMLMVTTIETSIENMKFNLMKIIETK